MKMDLDKFKSLQEYSTAHPFPHAVIDKVFEDDILKKVASEFPDSDSKLWTVFNQDSMKRLACYRLDEMKGFTVTLLSHLMGPEFVSAVRKMTGIENLLPSLSETAIHMMPPGSFTRIHLDFNHKYQTYRRVVLTLSLNEEWMDSWGGHLEFWDEKELKKKITPSINRLVIFTNSEKSFHGNPSLIESPHGVCRKNIVMYYFTENPPENVGPDHDYVTAYYR